MFLSRDVIFKETIFPFKHWLPKIVYSSPSSFHNVFPSQPPVQDSVPHISAEFSLPFNSGDTVVPPDEFPNLVHADLTSSQPILSPQPEPSAPADLPIVPPALPLVRKSTRSHKLPSYLHDYHYSLVSTHHCNLASTSLPSHDSFTASPDILYPLSSPLSYSKLFTAHRVFSIALTIAKEPTSYVEALPDPLWQAAMQTELDALQANQTWVMTPLPPSKVPIGCK